MRNDIRQCTSLKKLHHNPKLVLDKKRVVHLNNIWVMMVTHNDNLVKEKLTSLLLPQVHLLHSYLSLCVSIVSNANDARRALANFEEVVEEGSVKKVLVKL